MVLHTHGYRRQTALAAALLGVCFNATFMVWHAAGMLARAPEAARLVADLAVLCHSWAQRDSDRSDSPLNDPSAPSGSDTPVCPICQANVPTAAAMSAPQAIPSPRVTPIKADYCELPAGSSAQTVERPRNRDPPSIV